jgi:hypothetical protein
MDVLMMQTRKFSALMSSRLVMMERNAPKIIAILTLDCAYMFKAQLADLFARPLLIAFNGETTTNSLITANNHSVTKLEELVSQSMHLMLLNVQFQIATKFAHQPNAKLSLALMIPARKLFALLKLLIAMTTMIALMILAMKTQDVFTSSLLAILANNALKMLTVLHGVSNWGLVSPFLAIPPKTNASRKQFQDNLATTLHHLAQHVFQQTNARPQPWSKPWILALAKLPIILAMMV